MNVVAIIQARMGSTRLPGKMLMPLAGAPLIQRVIERTQRATKLDEVMLAFPEPDRHAFQPVLDAISQQDGVRFTSMGYGGYENDLVARYVCAAQLSDADLIVRIPGDNPCVQPEYIDMAVQEYLENPYIYYSNTTLWKMSENINVDGLGAEVFSMSRLKWLDQRTGWPTYREHPHRFFEDRGMLKTYSNTLRLDVNTQADYDFIADLYAALWPANHKFTITDILAYLERKQVTA